MSLPTDCDNRNERRGWLGDAAYSCDETLFNLDYANFYINFLQLIADAEMQYGSVPPQVPYTVNTGFPADPNWSRLQQYTTQPVLLVGVTRPDCLPLRPLNCRVHQGYGLPDDRVDGVRPLRSVISRCLVSVSLCVLPLPTHCDCCLPHGVLEHRRPVSHSSAL